MNSFTRSLSGIIIGCLFGFFSDAQTTLSAGDIAFTGYNSDNTAPALDTFSFMITRSGGISNGTIISFTDNGWLSATSALATNEGVITWTCSGALAQGTQVKIGGLSALIDGVANGSVANTSNASAGLSLATTGDQVLAFQGASTSPTFIAGIHMNVCTVAGDGADSDANNWDGSLVSTNRSAKPPGLTTGTTAIWFTTEVDNARYNCTSNTGATLALATTINTPSNWSTDDINPFALPPTCTPTSTTWNGSTWNNGTPSSSQDAVIASNTAPPGFTCKSLTINSGYALGTTGITVTVNGNITNNGNGIAGTGTMVIAAASTLSGNALAFGGTLNLLAGTFITSGLLSIAPGGAITGTYANLSGNVTLQQDMIGQRGWRIFSNPFTTAQAISTLASSNNISITTTVQASGLTDARTFSNSTNAWSNVTGSTLAANTAYALFIRGLASEVTGSNYTGGPTAFTYKATGTLNGNTVSIAPTNTANFILVGNPYAAPVKTSALTNGTAVSYYVYTIAQGGTQSLQRTKAGNWSAVLSSATTTTIPVMGAIAYKPSSTTPYNITASTDLNTTGTLQTGLFRTQETISHLELQVGQDGMLLDKFFVRMDNNATKNGNDRNDLEKFWNDNVNLYSKTADNRYLGIDARQQLDSINLGFSALTGDYVFKVGNNSLPANYNGYLKDNFLHTRTELKEGTAYPFSVTQDAESRGEERFVLEFTKALPITAMQAFDVKVLGNMGSNTIRLDIAGSSEPVTVTVSDLLGRKLATASNLSNGTVSIQVGNVGMGMYIIQASNGKESLSKKIIKF